MAFTDATDDSVSDSFARLKKASQKPKEPRVELAQATTTASDAGGGQKSEISPYMAKAKAEGEKATLEAAEAQYKKQQSEGKAAVEKARQAAIYEEYKPQLTQKFEPFQAPKETFASLAGLGVMLMAIGSMGGKKGLTSATGAMNAIAGMATGYQQGKKEEFDRQKAIFDENFRIMKENQAVIQKEFEYALKYAQRDVSGATSRLATTLKSLGLEAPATALKNGTETIQSAAEKTLSPMAKGLNEVQKKKLELDQQIREANAKIEEQKAVKTTTSSARPVEIINKDGKREAITVQEFNERRAKGEDMQIAPKQGASGSQNVRFAANMQDAFAQAAVDLDNVTKMPKDTILGTFSGMTGQSGKGLVDSLTNSFARKITPQDERTFQQILSGLELNMSKALGGGYASSSAKHVVDAYKAQVAASGDSPANKALFLARMKQELNVFADNYETYPGATPDMVAKVKKYEDVINKAIPFNVQDVLEAENKLKGSSKGMIPGTEKKKSTSGPQEGETSLSKSGRPIIYRNGKWEYNDASTQ